MTNISRHPFTDIETYIESCALEVQPLLIELRNSILAAAPAETTETILYKMPTFRYHGNLIHFAAFKNHIGVYPGTSAITHFEEQLKVFKTTKGAFHLPLDKPLPIPLIQEIVQFNAKEMQHKVVPNWHSNRDAWIDCIEIMEEIVATIDLTKEFKWGTTVYTFQGKNVIGWSGFKQFFSIWFYNGVFLKDPENVLISASEGKTKALRQWRFENATNMDPAKIRAYILESIETIREGKEIKKERSTAKEPEGLLKAQLEADVLFNTAFVALTPGRRKEYQDYIDDAKQEKTKITRLEKIKPLILAGQGLNDKYKR